MRKTIAVRLCVSLAVVHLGGCAYLSKTTATPTATKTEAPKSQPSTVGQWVLPEHVQNWLDDKEYGLVLDWLDTIPHDEPGFEGVKEIHKEVRQRAKNYESGVLKEVAKEQQKGNMDTVFLILSNALRRMPNSKPLQVKRNKLFSKQMRQISYLNRQSLIARGEYLLKEAQSKEQLAQIDWDNPSARWNVKRIKEEMKIVAQEMLRCGRQAMREGFLKQAQDCVAMAGRMHTTKEQIILSRQLQKRQRIQQRRDQLQKEKAKAKSKKVTVAQLEFLAKKALTQGRLRAALDIIEELSRMQKDDPQVHKLKAAVEAKIASRVDALMKRGNQLYKNGSMEDAKRDWEEVLKLDPNNKEARNNVQRAQRVLEKLIELQGEDG